MLSENLLILMQLSENEITNKLIFTFVCQSEPNMFTIMMPVVDD